MIFLASPHHYSDPNPPAMTKWASVDNKFIWLMSALGQILLFYLLSRTTLTKTLRETKTMGDMLVYETPARSHCRKR